MSVLLTALALSVARGDSPPASGDALQLWTCNATSARQNFTTLPSSSGGPSVFVSLSAQRDLVLDLAGPSRAVGTPAHIWGRYTPDVPNQLWSLGGGSLASDYAAGLCLAVAAPNLGAPLALATCSAGDPLQAFTLDAATGLIHSGALCVQAGGPGVSCALPPFSTYMYCNASASLDARVADLVARLTLEEKVNALDSSVPAVPRLGLPSLHSGEALHGAATGCLPPNLVAPNSTGCPTSFPAPVALGATFDVGVIRSVGGAIGREARALEAAGIGALWVFAPNLNPSRDQRWGRAQEVPSEDATVVSSYGVAFVSGLQGLGESPYLLAAATLKHFVSYGSSQCSTKHAMRSTPNFPPSPASQTLRVTFRARIRFHGPPRVRVTLQVAASDGILMRRLLREILMLTTLRLLWRPSPSKHGR